MFHVLIVPAKSVRYIDGCTADTGWDQILKGLGTKIRKLDFVLEEVRCHCRVLSRGGTCMFLFRKITRVQDGRWIGEKNWSRKGYLGERRRDCILRPWGYRKVGEFKREGSRR